MFRSGENIEKVFYDDVRTKKRIGRGSFAMRGKGVKHGISGALRTPYYYMTNKEKKKLNGEVAVYHMYETIIPYEELMQKDEEIQRNMLVRWREIYPTKKIKQELNIPNNAFYALVNRLNIPKKELKPQKKKEGTTPTPKKQEKSIAIQSDSSSYNHQMDKPYNSPEPQHQASQENIRSMMVTNGLHLEYNGDYNSEELNKLFTKLQLLVDGESNKYRIRLSLTETDS